jgi:hypothetical protein
MKIHTLILATAIAFGLPALHAQGGGGGGGGGGGAGGGASGGGGAASSGTGAAGTPNAGSAGAGTSGVSGVPNGPATVGGVNNAGNDPSGIENSSKVPSPPGVTTGMAPARQSDSRAAGVGSKRGDVDAAPGTTSAGTAQASGGNLRQNGTRMPGLNGPTTTRDQDSDQKIDEENRKLDRMVKSICKGC